jgi:hypothetical protein
VGDCGRLWAIVGDCGRLWAIVGDCGRLWATVGDCGRLWATVGDCGRLWAIVGDCGRLWAIVGDCGRFWVLCKCGGAFHLQQKCFFIFTFLIFFAILIFDFFFLFPFEIKCDFFSKFCIYLFPFAGKAASGAIFYVLLLFICMGQWANLTSIGLELYGQFWLTAPMKPKERFALIYFSEALVVYEQWGATAKVNRLREKIAKISPYDPMRAGVLNYPRSKVRD